MIKKLLWLGIAAIAIVAAGFQYITYSKEQSRANLLARANQYLEAMRLNDFHTLYNLESGSVEGRLRPDEAYMGNQDNIRILGFDVQVEDFEGNSANVKVTTRITFPELNGKEVTGGAWTDPWIRIKGNWYHKTPAAPTAPKSSQ